VLKEIRTLQKTTHLLRLAREIPVQFAFLVVYFSLHAGRVTLFPKDVQLARRIRGIQEGL
nr:centromere-specific histone CENP-A - bovine (fragments) [Bos taurus]